MHMLSNQANPANVPAAALQQVQFAATGCVTWLLSSLLVLLLAKMPLYVSF
jgi:hypothetical protein